MADIDQIIAGGAGASSRADFSGIPKILDNYWAGLDQRAKNDLRDAFKPTADNPNGIPMKDGQPDVGAMAKTLFQKGDIANGTALLGQGQNAAERAMYAGIDPQAAQQPQARMPVTDAPSPSRSIQGQVAPKLSKGGVQDQGSQPPQGGFTTTSYLAAAGIPNGEIQKQATSLSNQLGISPTDIIDTNDPRIRNVIVPAVAFMKRNGIGQVQPPQAGDGQPMPQVPQGQAPPQMAQAPMQPPQGISQQAPQGFQPSPAQVAAQNDPELKRLRFKAASPNPAVAHSGQMELKSYIESKQPTTEMRNAAAPGLLERQGEQAAQQAGAVENAKTRVVQYQTINEVGDKAAAEIPKLQLAVKLMDSPDFQSGAGQRFDLLYRRIASRFGDPDKAAPQEIVSKVIADSVLNGLGALKGLGPIRVAEMNLARTAAMSMDNTPQTNRFLANTAIRIQQRAVAVQAMAQDYNDGVLDVGFDKKIREMDKKNPLFTPEEVQRFQKIIGGEEKKQGAQPAKQGPSSTPRFELKAQRDAAIASGQLKKGDSYIGGDGVERYVP